MKALSLTMMALLNCTLCIAGNIITDRTITLWHADGNKVTEHLERTDADSTTFLIDAKDAIAVDLTDAEPIMVKDTVVGTWLKKHSTYQLTVSSNPNCIYFVSEHAHNYEELEGLNVVKGSCARQLTLTDGHPYYTPRDITADVITYARIFNKGVTKKQGGGWQTMVLPFSPQSVSVAGSGSKTWFKQADDDADFWVYRFTSSTATTIDFDYTTRMESNTPYVVGVPDGTWGETNSLEGATLIFAAENVTLQAEEHPVTVKSAYYHFVGTFAGADQLTNAYMLDTDGARFVAGSGSVSAFRAWFVGASGAQHATSLLMNLADDTATRIGSQRADSTTGSQWFTLQGTTAKSGHRGICIQREKKVIR